MKSVLNRIQEDSSEKNQPSIIVLVLNTQYLTSHLSYGNISIFLYNDRFRSNLNLIFKCSVWSRIKLS